MALYTYTNTGSTTLTLTGATKMDFLIVGGGGGGGHIASASYGAGGGGAGGVLIGTKIFKSGRTITICVGSGGTGAYIDYTDHPPTNGGDSYVDCLTAYGGGRGGNMSAPYGNPLSGGSGGGGLSFTSYRFGANGISGQGNEGADGNGYGGGGGGAGSAGSGRIGGNGRTSSLSGSLKTYGVGGNGGENRIGADVNGADALDNTGNGGGGATCGSVYAAGGDGGSGIVIIDVTPYSSTFNVPSGLTVTASAATESSIRINWVNTQTQYISETIIQRLDGSNWVNCASASSGATTATVSDLEIGTTYTFRVAYSSWCELYPSTETVTGSTSATLIPRLSGFTGNGTMVIPTGYTKMEYLIVAGGGKGGWTSSSKSTGLAYGGGGGAGGMLEGIVYYPVAGTYSVVIGAGGDTNDENGGNSSFYGFTATGGGCGGYGINATTETVGGSKSGGSGGGGGATYTKSGSKSNGTSGQGSAGADGASNSRGGGGGGAGSAGSAGSGGSGKSNSLSGSLVTYAAGGGTRNTHGNGTNASANTGDGGGGSCASFGSGGSGTGGNGGSGIVYVKLTEAILVNTAPSGLSTTNVSCTGTTLNWVNTDSGRTGNKVYAFNGTSYDLVATLASGTTSYNLTGLTPNFNYYYKVSHYNGSFEKTSTAIYSPTLNPAPFNLNGVVTDLSIDLTWELNDPAYGISIVPTIKKLGDVNWISGDTLSKNATGCTITGLTWNTQYMVSVIRVGSNYPSENYYFSTVNFQAPSDLIATSVGNKQVCLSWTNNSDNDDIGIWYKKEDLSWQLFQTVVNGTTSICVTGLFMNKNYTFAVLNNYNSYSLLSNQITEKTTVTWLPSFCDGTNYSITGTTCGNNDGIIEINEDYTIFYNFVLQDIFGNSYTLTDYYWTGLTSSWYFITATPNSEYSYYYGNQPCYINWIEISDSNTPLILLSTKIRPQQCGPFDVQYGRIFYNVTGLTSGNTYSFYAFTDDLKPYYSKTGITFTEDFLIANAMARCYYGVIIDEVSGCKLLLDIKCVPSVTIFSNNGIKKLYITPWTSNVDYNYWKSSDDDYFLEFEDTSFFTSTKMKEYISLSGGTLTWYKLPVERKVVSVSQKLNKVPQGYIFTDTLSVAISKANADKWTKISRIINPENKWIYVAEDSNGNIWTGGYLYGARIDTYSFDIGARGADNGYKLTFTCVSENKLLTSLDVNYFNNYIV